MIVDLHIHSKPQAIFKHLISGHYNFDGLKYRRLKSANNSNYEPLDIA